jgi:hypothetical protein
MPEMKITVLALWFMMPDGSIYTSVEQVSACPDSEQFNAQLQQMVDEGIILNFSGECGPMTVVLGDPV